MKKNGKIKDTPAVWSFVHLRGFLSSQKSINLQEHSCKEFLSAMTCRSTNSHFLRRCLFKRNWSLFFTILAAAGLAEHEQPTPMLISIGSIDFVPPISHIFKFTSEGFTIWRAARSAIDLDLDLQHNVEIILLEGRYVLCFKWDLCIFPRLF